VTRPLAAATARLAAAGVPSPRVDAELLLAHVLDVPRSRLLLTDGLDAEAATAYATAIDRRIAREPLQHIVGTAPFRHLELAVGPGVFVPRPETELLVDAVPAASTGPDAVVVDLCSGSGALALAIADETPAGRIVAVERPGPAIDWLRRNARGTRIEVIEGDVTDPSLLAELSGGVDVVVGNPPYVPSTAAVGPEVGFDPEVAVFAGPDGLAVMPHVLARAAQLLRAGGVLAVEHDDSHGEAVPMMLRVAGRWHEIADHADLAGRPRYATAVRT
jgi:release factor glutamine methyltransferase